jgi:hypothetical protein
MKKILIISIALFISSFAQLRLINEEINGANYILTFSNETTYGIVANEGRDVIQFSEYFEQERKSLYLLPTFDLFISIPHNFTHGISYRVLSDKVIKALPKPSSQIVLDKQNSFLSDEMDLTSSMNTNSFLTKLGYLWIGNNYCIHLKISPYSINADIRGTHEVKEFNIELKFPQPFDASMLNEEQTPEPPISNHFNNLLNAKVQSENYSGRWIDYSNTYAKMGVAQDGVYRISYSDLINLGFPLQQINPKKLAIVMKGNQIPIYVAGEADDSFDQEDFIEFVGIRNMGGKHREINNYGEPYNEFIGRYSDTTIYWLTWGNEYGLRVQQSFSTEPSMDTLKYYHELIHYEINNWFDFSMADLVRREMPNWYENKTWHQNNIGVGVRSFTFNVSELFPNRQFHVFSKQQSYASSITNNAHLLGISVNSLSIQDSGYINKYQQKLLKGSYNSSLINNGNNTLKITSFATGSNPNACIFDWYEVEYPRYLRTYNDSLLTRFPFLDSTPTPKLLEITNVTTDSIIVWKYGNEFKRFVIPRTGSNLYISDTLNNQSKFALIKESKILKPKIYYAKQFLDLSSSENRADYIGITHKRFKEIANSYANFISNHYNVNAKIVDVEDIYDQFSYGFFNPEAIKEFLKTAHSNWQLPKPKYVTLIGGATYDYNANKTKFQNSPPVYNYVPSFGASVSDNWFVTWDTTGAYIPQMNIGRIPVKNESEFQNYFNKHVNYVSNPFNEWNKNYLFFSGGTGTDQNQLNQLREVNNFVVNNYVSPAPIGGNSTHFYKTINPTTNFGPYTPEQFQKAIDDGAVFISYLGHSGTQTWDNSITQPAQLKNKVNRSPLITDFGCSTARFAEPDVTSFSQLFVLSNEGQAIAYIGNASLGFLSTSTIAPKLFYKKVLQDSVYNISEALKLAKLEMLQTYGSSGVYQLFALTNTLIGDPIINLSIPPKPNLTITSSRVELSNNTPSDDIDSITINLNYLNTGKVTSDSFYINISNVYNDSTSQLLETRRVLPKYSDSLSFSLRVKNSPGIHRISVHLDSENEINEISKSDNLLQFNINVASTSIRTTMLNEIENGSDDSIYFLNPVGKPASDTLIVQISNNSNFDFASSLQVKFDTLFTKIHLPNLSMGDRYWIRSRVKETESYGRANSFLFSGMRNYSLQDQQSYSNAELNQVSFQDNKLSLSSETSVISAMSAGFNDGNSAVIELNSQNLIPENTMRGHHVCLFRDSTYEFINYMRYDLLGGGASALTNYINLLDTLSSNVIIVIAIADEGSTNSSVLKNQIKTIGSKYIDSLVFRGSWAIIGKKGAAPGSVPEAFTKQFAGRAEIDTTIYKRYNSGSLLTSIIGPVAKWDDINVEQQMESNASITFRPVGIRESGVMDTLNYLTLINNSASLGHLDASIYPHIKILADFNASSDSVSPSLSSLAVNFKLLPELGVNYQTVSLSKDSIIVGDSIKISAMIMNVGETTAEDVKVVFELVRPDNTKRKLFEQRIQEFKPFERKRLEYVYHNTRWEGVGDFSVNVIVDSGNNIKELYKDNNTYRLNFKIKPDTVTSIIESAIEMTVNNKEIYDGDFIPSHPDIKIELRYPTWFEVDDSTAVQFYLNDNKLTTEQFSGISFDTTNRTMTFNYKNLLADGEYRLKIFTKDVNGILSNTPVFERFFVVYNELKIAQVYNYPNPFTEGTNFTFKLTQVPDEVVIRIYTVAGRLIREMKKSSAELNTDFNYLPWDGRDQDGDLIANGVYLYKVIAKLGDKTEHITEKLAKIR